MDLGSIINVLSCITVIFGVIMLMSLCYNFFIKPATGIKGNYLEVFTLKEEKQDYIDRVYKEMQLRGCLKEDIPKVISKTGFMAAVDEYPEIQLRCNVSCAVDDIIKTAALYQIRDDIPKIYGQREE